MPWFKWQMAINLNWVNTHFFIFNFFCVVNKVDLLFFAEILILLKAAQIIMFYNK